jgi:S-(hydroxymethyl)glutathione dehydrogenase / alcohol dehydrogenase
MKAAVLYAPHTAQQIEQVDLDQPRQNEILIRLTHAGVCRSDHHVISGALPMPVPIVLGHEGAGVVEKVGPGVTRFEAGDHVSLNFTPFCGYCQHCNAGQPNLCQHRPQLRASCRLSQGDRQIHNFLGMSCFAEYTVVHESGAVKVAKDLPLDRVALVSCGVSTGVGAVVNTARVRPGQTVAVVGTGGVGLNVIQGARLVRAATIIAVDRFDHKLDLAADFGATHLVNAEKDDPVKRVKEIVKGGVDFAFEAIGLSTTIEQIWNMIRPGGMAVVVGVPAVNSTVTLAAPRFTDERTIRGSFFGSIQPSVDIPRYLDLYRQGQLKLDELITRHYPLDQVNEAFAALERGEVARSVLDVG